jgi:hypothetical protein
VVLVVLVVVVITMDPQYITVLHPNDVLFGRGSGPNDHEGNIKFRELVLMRKTEYMATNHRQTKAKIALSIVETVFLSNGRFLKKIEGDEAKKLGLPNGTDAYTIADHETIMEKAKQALRQNREKEGAAGGGGGARSPKSTSPKGTISASHHLPPSLLYDTSLLGPPSIMDLRAPLPPIASPTFSRPSLQDDGTFSKYVTSPVLSGGGSRYSGGGGVGVDDEDDAADLEPQPINFNHVQGVQRQQQQQGGGDHNDNGGIYISEEGFATYTTTLPDDDEDDNQRPSPSHFGGRRDSSGMYALQNTNNMMADGTRRGSLGMSVGSFSTGGSTNRRGSLVSRARRESIKIDDVWRRDILEGGRGQSMQMSDLMESFKGMSTTGENGEFNSSSDTIGTIGTMDGPTGNTHNMSGLSQMSLVSMSSATSLFSRMQSVDNIDQLSPTPPPGTAEDTPPNRSSGGGGGDQFDDPRQFFRSRNSATEPAPIRGMSFEEQQRILQQQYVQQEQQKQQRQQQQQQQQDQYPMGPPEGVQGGGGGGHAHQRQSLLPHDLWNPRAMGVGPRTLNSMNQMPDQLSGLGGSSASVLRAAAFDSGLGGVGGNSGLNGNMSSGLMSFGRMGSSMTASVFDINNSSLLGYGGTGSGGGTGGGGNTGGSDQILPPGRKDGL